VSRLTAPTYAGLAEALTVPETEVRIFGKPVSRERRRMGVAFSTAETVDVARERATEAASAVTVGVDEVEPRRRRRVRDGGRWGR
jgi:phosphoribosylglycinamide formyltransferase 2